MPEEAGAAAGRAGVAATGVVRALAAGVDGAGDLLGGDEGADVTDAGLLALGVVCIEEVCCDTCARDTGWLLPEEAGAAAGREGVAAAGADGAGDLLGAVEGVVLDGDACAVLPDEGLDELLELELLEDDLLPELPPRDIMRPPFQVESKSFLHP